MLCALPFSSLGPLRAELGNSAMTDLSMWEKLELAANNRQPLGAVRRPAKAAPM